MMGNKPGKQQFGEGWASDSLPKSNEREKQTSLNAGSSTDQTAERRKTGFHSHIAREGTGKMEQSEVFTILR